MISKPLLLSIGAGGAAVAAVVASANTIGTVDANHLGAGVGVVASCDDDGVGIDYTTAYDEAIEAYKVTAVVLTGVDEACAGQAIRVTLVQNGNSLGEATGTMPGGSATSSGALPVTGTAKAQLVTDAAVVISD